jgi:heat shock protein 4
VVRLRVSDAAGAIGIDLGSQTAVIAVAKKGGVEIVINEANYRETQLVVGFGDSERFIGEQAHVQLKSNFKNSLVYPTRFLGLKPDSALVNEEKKWLYTPLVTNTDNKLVLETRYRGEKKHFLPEQVVAMTLQKLQSYYRKIGVAHNDVVLSAPAYYTEQERKSLLDAAKIAGLNVMKLMNETTAIALSYGIFRRTEFDANPRYVCFVDVGHSSTSIFVASFTKEKLTMMNQLNERGFGTREFDWKLLEFYAKMFKDQNDVNIMNNAKARLRILESVEKQRRVLSANIEAGINVEYLAEDFDLNHNLTREKFEEVNVDNIARFKGLLEKLKSEIKVDLHSVEIIGGGTRIPILQKIIQETFGMEISRTLNSSECIARGCAIQAAMLSPLFKVAEYGIEETNYYPIRCSWLFLNPEDNNMSVENDAKNNVQKQTSILFDKGCAVPSVKAITFHREDPLIDFKLTYDPIPTGADALLAHYTIHNIKAKEADFGVKVRVILNKNGILEFDSAQLLEDYLEEVPVEKPAEKKEGAVETENKPEETKETEIKKKKKTRATNLKTDVSNFNVLDPKVVSEFAQEEVKMGNIDRITHETYEKKNQLESYIYDMRSKLGDVFANYVHPNVKTTFLAELSKVENWLYGEGAKTTKEAYSQKVDELLFFGGPIDRRFKEYNTIPEAAQHFLQTLAAYESVLNSNEEQYAHISPEEKKPVYEAISSNKKWLNDITEKIKTANRAEEPPVKSGEINDTHKNFINEYSKVINKPKPKPVETPKETKKEEMADEAKEKKTEAGQDGAKKDMDIE